MAEKPSSQEVIEVLRGCRIFSGMSEQTAHTLGGLPTASFCAGDILAGGEAFSPRLGVLLSGKANIYGRGSGRRVLLNRIGRGDVFGAACVFFAEPKNVSTVAAVSKGRILFIERGCLETIMKSDFSVAAAYIEFLSGKICFLNQKIIAFTAKSAESALAGFLLEQAERADVLHVAMTRLASILGIGRTTLYRALDTLERDGCIACEGKEIRILDKNRLETRY